MPLYKVNSKCHCGSNKKYKKCCMKNDIDVNRKLPPHSFTKYV